MPPVTHTVSYKTNLNNLPNFKYEGYCTCGFQTKQATEEAAKSQMENHLTVNGVVQTRVPVGPVTPTKQTGWQPATKK